MIICICNNLNEQKLAEAMGAGAKSAADIYAYFGLQMGCGSCCEEIEWRLDLVRSGSSRLPHAPAAQAAA